MTKETDVAKVFWQAANDSSPRLHFATGADGVALAQAHQSGPFVEGIQAARVVGKTAGVLSADPALATKYLDAGVNLVAVGVDTTLLVRAVKDMLSAFSRNMKFALPESAPQSVYRRVDRHIVSPPEASMTAPFTKLASSPARNA